MHVEIFYTEQCIVKSTDIAANTWRIAKYSGLKPGGNANLYPDFLWPVTFSKSEDVKFKWNRYTSLVIVLNSSS